jgi:hypothetical protein
VISPEAGQEIAIGWIGAVRPRLREGRLFEKAAVAASSELVKELGLKTQSAIFPLSIPAQAGTHFSAKLKLSSSGNTLPIFYGPVSAAQWTPAFRRGGGGMDGGRFTSSQDEEFS